MDASAEFEFLVDCIRHRVDEDLVGRRDPKNRIEHIDWSAFMALTQRHKVVPHVFAALCNDHVESVPSYVTNQLNDLQQRSVMNNMRLAHELRRVVAACGENGVPVVAFKGPTLAMELYGGLQHRQFNDLDVMIRPQDLPVSLTALQRLGYLAEGRSIQQLDDKRLRQLSGRFHDHTLRRHDAQGCVKLDLHWRYSDDPAFFATRSDELFTGDAHCHIGEDRINTVPFAQNVAYLAFHACKHQCMRLSWLCDFGVAMNQMPRDQWPHFLANLRPGEYRFVVCALLMLERLSLTE